MTKSKARCSNPREQTCHSGSEHRAEVLKASARALDKSLGVPLQLTVVEDLPSRQMVVRCKVVPSTGKRDVPSTVIVKHFKSPPTLSQESAHGRCREAFERELAVLRALQNYHSDTQLAPNLLAEDPTVHALVLEDCAGTYLGESYYSDEAVARSLGRRLSVLHAAPGNSDYRICPRYEGVDLLANSLSSLADSLKVHTDGGWRRELAVLLQSSTDERLQALVHGDFAPDNLLFHKGEIVIIDFEAAGIGCRMDDLSPFWLAVPKRRFSTSLTNNFRAAFLRAYCEAPWTPQECRSHRAFHILCTNHAFLQGLRMLGALGWCVVTARNPEDEDISMCRDLVAEIQVRSHSLYRDRNDAFPVLLAFTSILSNHLQRII